MVFFSRKFTFKIEAYNAPLSLIYLNKYIDSFPGATMADKMGVTELNEILLNSMPNIWSKQAYLQGFDCSFFKGCKYVWTYVNRWKYLWRCGNTFL